MTRTEAPVTAMSPPSPGFAMPATATWEIALRPAACVGLAASRPTTVAAATMKAESMLLLQASTGNLWPALISLEVYAATET